MSRLATGTADFGASRSFCRVDLGARVQAIVSPATRCDFAENPHVVRGRDRGREGYTNASSAPGANLPAAREGGAESAPVPVTTATVKSTVKSENVPIIIRALGSGTAFNTVAIKSQVLGNVLQINFTEGQEVKTRA